MSTAELHAIEFGIVNLTQDLLELEILMQCWGTFYFFGYDGMGEAYTVAYEVGLGWTKERQGWNRYDSLETIK